MHSQHYDFSLLDTDGRRKYLAPQESMRFLAQANLEPLRKKTFVLMLFWTGCRISEALELDSSRIDFHTKSVTIRCLKKRKKIKYRRILLPDSYLEFLYQYIEQNIEQNSEEQLWTISRKTGYRWVKNVMNKIGINGIHACPKGLRHSFGVDYATFDSSLSKTMHWMGHENIRTTLIYTNALALTSLGVQLTHLKQYLRQVFICAALNARWIGMILNQIETKSKWQGTAMQTQIFVALVGSALWVLK